MTGRSKGLVLPAALLYVIGLAMVVAGLARSGIFQLRMVQMDFERLQDRQAAEAAIAGLRPHLPNLPAGLRPGSYLCAPSDKRALCTAYDLPSPSGLTAKLLVGVEVGEKLPASAGIALGGNSLGAWRFRRIDLHAADADQPMLGLSERWWLREPLEP